METGDMNGKWQVQVFYDGDCPLCSREIALLRRWDKRQRIKFTDIADPAFDPQVLGVSMEALMAEIHGRLPDGSWILGVEVFRRLYAAVGLGWLVAPTRLPGVAHLLDAAYRAFAKRRLKWTGRCAAACHLPTPRDVADDPSNGAAGDDLHPDQTAATREALRSTTACSSESTRRLG